MRRGGIGPTLLLGVLAAAGEAQVESLEVPPSPPLARVEPSVREAIELRRRAVFEGEGEPASEQARLWGELALSLHAHDFRDEAAICYARAEALAPRDPRWPHLHGLLLFEAGDFPAAAERFDRALDLRPTSVATLLRAGEARRRALDVPGARAAFEAALDLDPEAAAGHCGLGALAVQEGRVDDAVREYESCLARQPKATRVHAILASLYRRRGDRERAASEAAQAGSSEVVVGDPFLAMVEAAAAHGDVHLARGADAVRQGRFAAALAEYEQALAKGPDDPRVHLALGTVYERLDQLEASARHYRRAAELDEEDVLSRFNLASLLAREGRYEAAIPYLEEVTELDPADREAARNLAWLCTRANRLEKAAGVYAALLEGGLEDPQVYRDAAGVLLRVGRREEAQVALAAAVAGNAADGESRILLGLLAAEEGRLAEAEAHLEDALDLPLHEELASRGHYLLGLVRERQGRAGEAIDHLRESLRLAAVPAPPALQLARLLAAAGQCAEAKEALELARRSDPAAPGFAEIGTFVDRCTTGTGS